MPLPEDLAAAVQRHIENVDRRRLARASEELSQRYREADFFAPVIVNEAHRAAYLATRVPATYAANASVFAEVCRLVPQACSEVASFLDLGAGPGTSLWAAAGAFSRLQHATLMESDQEWLNLGPRIAEHSPLPALRHAQWVRQDLRAAIDCTVHDLVVLSYTLGELPRSARNALLLRAWSLADRFLVLIEPGTPRGFGVVHAARTALIASGAKMLAPCPHCLECPMAVAGDWCHFAQRVPRSSLHRQIKGGSLGYEDEKFSYVVVSRQSFATVASRIVRHPQKLSGHVLLTLCTQGGIENRTVTRSKKEDFRLARRAEWGGSWSV
jgi:ribosomal protein RSM22 (predicted rRNA methylase)